MVTNISGYCLMCEGVKLNMVNQSQNRRWVEVGVGVIGFMDKCCMRRGVDQK